MQLNAKYGLINSYTTEDIPTVNLFKNKKFLKLVFECA